MAHLGWRLWRHVGRAEFPAYHRAWWFGARGHATRVSLTGLAREGGNNEGFRAWGSAPPMTSLLDERSASPDRFRAPLYTVAEAARYLDVPASTLGTWAHGYRRAPVGRQVVTGAPVVTTVAKQSPRAPDIPFIGLAEGLVLAAMRRSGVPLQRIRPALVRLGEQFGLTHALASRQLYTDGAEVLFDYANARDADPGAAHAARELVVVRNDQHVFNDIVAGYLRRLEYGGDRYPRMIGLPAYRVAEVVVDPTRGFGQPIFTHGGARLDDVLGMFRAGEPLEVAAEEYGVPLDELEDVLRIATRPAA